MRGRRTSLPAAARAALEGGADFKDPQTIVTFALLGTIVIGAVYNLAVNGIPPQS